MQPQEGFFRGVRNTNIYYQKWLPEGDPQAVLIIVHGLAEHLKLKYVLLLVKKDQGSYS